MKKQSSSNDYKSLKAFFLYVLTVFFVVFIALSVRLFFIYRQSKFDGHNIAIAITTNKKLVSVLGMDSQKKFVSILEIKKGDVHVNDISETLGIVPESVIDSEKNISKESVDSILSTILSQTDGAKTNLTIVDKIRLLILAKRISDVQREEISLPEDDVYINKAVIKLFSDNNIISENQSIQIINATDIPGLGQKLERIILNKGGNVISVTSLREKKQNSMIQFYGDRNYTVRKLGKILKIPTEQMSDKSMGEIAIIIGGDYKKIYKLN